MEDLQIPVLVEKCNQALKSYLKAISSDLANLIQIIGPSIENKNTNFQIIR